MATASGETGSNEVGEVNGGSNGWVARSRDIETEKQRAHRGVPGDGDTDDRLRRQPSSVGGQRECLGDRSLGEPRQFLVGARQCGRHSREDVGAERLLPVRHRGCRRDGSRSLASTSDALTLWSRDRPPQRPGTGRHNTFPARGRARRDQRLHSNGADDARPAGQTNPRRRPLQCLGFGRIGCRQLTEDDSDATFAADPSSATGRGQRDTRASRRCGKGRPGRNEHGGAARQERDWYGSDHVLPTPRSAPCRGSSADRPSRGRADAARSGWSRARC